MPAEERKTVMRLFGRTWCAVWCVSFMGGGFTTSAQVGGRIPPLPSRDEMPAALSFLSPLIPAKLFQDCYRLKRFIASEEFAAERKLNGDIYAVDLVFDRALRLSWSNRCEALLISCFAVMDHSAFGIRLPLVGALIWVPLTAEFEDEVHARVSALPSRLYPDTPPEEAGDRDKLQHFFGSAFLTYVTESAAAAERVGNFIEWGEEKFIVGGTYDERDLRANRQGQRFGMRLLGDPSARPSLTLLDQFSLPAPPAASESITVPVADSLHVLLEVR